MGFSEKESARAARDAHFHEVLFQAGGLVDGTELGYYSNTEVGTYLVCCFMYFIPSQKFRGIRVI